MLTVRGNMSLYSSYLRERSNDLIMEKNHAFATYRYLDEITVYIIDIYTDPEFREGRVATAIADEIVLEAKARGCTKLIGTVIPSMKNSTTSLKVLLGYGMTLKCTSPDLIVFEKEI